MIPIEGKAFGQLFIRLKAESGLTLSLFTTITSFHLFARLRLTTQTCEIYGIAYMKATDQLSQPSARLCTWLRVRLRVRLSARLSAKWKDSVGYSLHTDEVVTRLSCHFLRNVIFEAELDIDVMQPSAPRVSRASQHQHKSQHQHLV